VVRADGHGQEDRQLLEGVPYGPRVGFAWPGHVALRCIGQHATRLLALARPATRQEHAKRRSRAGTRAPNPRIMEVSHDHWRLGANMVTSQPGLWQTRHGGHEAGSGVAPGVRRAGGYGECWMAHVSRY